MTDHMASRSTAMLTIDLDRPGRHVGHVRIPHSPHDDAWGVTQIPIAVIAGGAGPTVIVAGGNHGDEYEGPIVISELVGALDPAEVSGRVILLPAINAPALEAARRVSPIDGVNMNRAFLGDPEGTMTEQIAAFLSETILPLGAVFLDLHSGGSSLWIMPSTILQQSGDAGRDATSAALARAFGAPATLLHGDWRTMRRTAMSAAARAGLAAVGTELGGGACVSATTMETCRRGVRNVLAHLGVVDANVQAPANPGLQLRLPAEGGHVYAVADGIFEPIDAVGDMVRAGDPAGRIWTPWDLSRAPAIIRYEADGLLYATRVKGRVRPGNCCAVVAQTL